TYWSGEASEENNRADSRELLAQIREALLEEDYERADELGHGFVGNKNNYGTNLPVGNFYINCFPEGRPEKEWEEAA
ncbi:glycoside hydrolase N-terminal domain-containing protein, partial [Eubacterium callanderi]|uniref:glycoside hydrolase N-terminal domain-containing protein n=1 Tax=Eubacterium callanderi TaxID=53442 RepID=UPI001AA19B15